jgi:D-serine deaminase-like pyridoxal phosphate-dependent protein
MDGLENTIRIYIDIDIGYGRTGVPSDHPHLIEELINAIHKFPHLFFSGFYCHAGHSYKAGNQPARDDIHRKAMSDLSRLKDQFAHQDPAVLYGDTPACTLQTSFGAVDEITPGNFVFYDLTQASMGSCTESDIAVAVACPVTGRYPAARQVLVHGGAVHFSKEALHLGDRPVYGKQVAFSGTGHGWTPLEDGAYITSITQEHGIVTGAERLAKSCKIGDILAFHPVHSCLTANLMRQYYTLEGDLITTLNSLS